ncbi:hypothetical protein [Thermostichus sp. MS-CIW-28]|jgi:uncharacterized membrane protein
MKCVEESHNKRVYQEPLKDLSFRLLFAFIPLSVAFIPLSASTLLWLHQGDRHFTCFRVAQSAVNCEVFFQPLLPLPSTTKLYKDVREAGTKTEIETDEDGDRTTYYYVTLKTPAGERKAWSASSESEAQELAWRVQSFVNGTESQLLVDSDKFDLGDLVIVILLSLIYSLFSLPFLLIGVSMLISALWRRRVTLDSSLYQIQEEYLTPFGSRGQKTYSFRDVQQVTVQARTDSDGDTSFSVEVTLQSQKPLLSISSGGESEARAEAEKLGQFLGCPVILLETKKIGLLRLLKGRRPGGC